MRESYEALGKFYQDSRLLSPYLWQSKKHGQSRKPIRINDIVYISKLNRLGQVIKLRQNQLKLMYKDSSNNAHKSELSIILGGTSLDPEEIPEAMFKEMSKIDLRKELVGA